MAFKLITTNVYRDFVQGLYGNRIPLDDEDVLEFLKLWDELVAESLNDDEASIIYDDYEIGGAHPQVTAEFTNRDFMEVYRILRKYAPHTAFRPLDRSANVFMLAPMSEEDIEHIIKQLAQDTANPAYAEKVKEKIKKFLNIKVFDSQGIIEEAQSTFNIIGKLRRGEYKDELGNSVEYLINAESAIPYGKGPFYPNAIYLKKVEDSYNALLAAGLPINESRISLKDMIGQLDAKAVSELLPAIIKKLKELQKDLGTEIPIGLHLHDTGCAKAAYLEAIKICKQEDYPIAIDTVECDPYQSEYVGENAYRNTGFVSLRDLNKACNEIGIDLGIKPSHSAKLDKMGAIALKVAKKYSVRRVESLFSGEELRDFDIPGGAFASFSDAVTHAELGKKLGLNERDALLLAGNGLKAVAKLMGYPFAVTPGFQNKQIAALNLINNLINNLAEGGKKLKSGMSNDEMIKLLLQDLSNEEVEKLFLNNLSGVVKEFLRGEMPADTLRKMGIETTAQVHPVIREKLGRRTKLLTDIEPKHKEARSVVERLDKEGLIKPTQTQIEAVNHEFQGQPDAVIQRILKERAIQTHITWALELGDPNRLEAALKKPWLREPDPKNYQGDKAGYLRALAKTKKGKNPVADEMEIRLTQMQQGKISLDTLYDYTQLVQEKERLEIWRSVLVFMKVNLDIIEAALVSDNKQGMDKIYEDLYNFQNKIIRSKENKGEYYITFNKRRHDMALDFFAQQLTQLNNSQSEINFHEQSHHKREEIEAITINAFMGARVESVSVKPGDEVKVGDELFVLQAMKIYNTFKASISGIIDKVTIKAGDMVEKDALLVSYVKEEPIIAQQQNITVNNKKIDPSPIEASLHKYRQDSVDLMDKISDMQKEMDQQVAKYEPANAAEYDLMKELQKRGYFGPPLSLTEEAKQGHENEIQVIGNRDTSGIKLLTDLTQANYDVRLLYAATDKDTNLVKHAKDSEKIVITKYDDEKSIISALLKLANDNPDKTIYYHPGWGFVSESADFVNAFETQLPSNVVFVGPPSNPMRIVGGKATCREMIDKVVPEFNPKHFKLPLFSSAQIQEYIASGFNPTHSLHKKLQHEYDEVAKIGGDVMIKATLGGGGNGIHHFIIDEKHQYQSFVTELCKNIGLAETEFKSGEMLIEEFIGGKTRHLEVQLVVNDMGAIVLGTRDCTSQHIKAKTNEMNVIQGDYPADVISDTRSAIDKLGKEMSDIGYRGLCTVELLIASDGSIIKKRILEKNPRLQVEHCVTEEDIRIKTGKNISLPLLNLACVREKNIPLAQILKRDFGFTDADIMSALALGTERVEHVRLNSFEIDVLTGNHGASFFWGYMWPGQDIIAKIAKDTGAHIIIGDIGAGNYNRQTGAVWGSTAQVHAALKQIHKMMEVAKLCTREDGTLSLNSVFAFHELVFDEKGNFSKEFTTLTQDEFLEAVKNKSIKVEMDKQHLSTAPALKPGAMGQAFQKFLEKQAENIAKQQQENTAYVTAGSVATFVK
ncbi:MAG: biotin/lipoyl-containing protein [Legionellales bacterium]|jgi:acetyl/propionyl-CoA carboxylase alpha subunit/pyruvate/oxaloacetate carboxyltransferase